MDDVFDSGEDAEKVIAQNDLKVHEENIIGVSICINEGWVC